RYRWVSVIAGDVDPDDVPFETRFRHLEPDELLVLLDARSAAGFVVVPVEHRRDGQVPAEPRWGENDAQSEGCPDAVPVHWRVLHRIHPSRDEGCRADDEPRGEHETGERSSVAGVALRSRLLLFLLGLLLQPESEHDARGIR